MTRKRGGICVGIVFHSCGCTGPGYIPNDKDALVAYFQNTLDRYNEHLDFWRNRTEPTTKPEIAREESKHWGEISSIPRDLRPKKGTVSNADAINFWIGRMKEVETKLALAKTSV